MKHFKRKLICAAALTVATGMAQAAIYIKYEGLDGESRSSGVVNEWQWLKAMSDDGRFDGFAPSFARGVLFDVGDLAGVSHLDEMVLTVADGPGQETYYKYELQNVLVSSYSVGAGSQGPSFELDSFASATMSWRPLLADGSRGEAIVGHWDRATGRFTGDLAVLGAFDDLGAQRWADGTLAITAAVPEPGTWALMLLGVAAIGARQRPPVRLA